MKQVLQSLQNGEIELAELPTPKPGPNDLLIQTSYSLISPGTERMLLSFGRGSMLDKAKQQPDKVKQVIQKISTDGMMATYKSIKSKLSSPIPLGYCSAGVVVVVGRDVRNFAVGDRVVSNGAHSEYVCVPSTLCAKVPDNVSLDDAPFAVLGAISLQGIRLASPTLGETFVVFGAGILGLLAAQLLKLHGCKVICLDISKDKCEIARSMGFESIMVTPTNDPTALVNQLTDENGADGVIMTLSTASSDPIRASCQMTRKRGRIVLVGIADLHFSRDELFKKEIQFSVSCSYGPGRYDEKYESGIDYPLPFVRWTAQRNFEAILALIADQSLQVKSLVSHKFLHQEATAAYDTIYSDSSCLTALFNYETELRKCDTDEQQDDATIQLSVIKPSSLQSRSTAGIIGAGNFAAHVVLPSLKRLDRVPAIVASSRGLSARSLAKTYGVSKVTTDHSHVLMDPSVRDVFILTRHDSHAALVCSALNAGKNVFCEKPLALSNSQLNDVIDCYNRRLKSGNQQILMVGFNRRFSPMVQTVKGQLPPGTPVTVLITVNAGFIPSEHWVHDSKKGGGRIVGEACHFIDLARFLANSRIRSTQARFMSIHDRIVEDNGSISLQFENGSIATIQYLSTGSKNYPKERIEVFCGGTVFQIDNFRKLRVFGKGMWPHTTRSWSSDKGHENCIKSFLAACDNQDAAPIAFDEIIEVSRSTLEASELNHGNPVDSAA